MEQQALPAEPFMAEEPTVVLIHGLGGNRWVMRWLERRLRAQGYRTVNWTYHSAWGSIDRHAQRLARRVEDLDHQRDCEPIHFVAHSLGSILVRAMLQQHRPHHMGRVVMLAPPNHGSPVATFFQSSLGRMMPVIPQLSNRPDSYVNQLPNPPLGVEVGVLAAKTDILVPYESTQLKQQCDHRTVQCRHFSIIFHREVPELVDRFLREGTFGACK